MTDQKSHRIHEYARVIATTQKMIKAGMYTSNGDNFPFLKSNHDMLCYEAERISMPMIITITKA